MTLLRPLWMQPAGGDPAIEYSSANYRSLLTWLVWVEGVTRLTHLKVTQRASGANFSVDVASGAAIILGDDVTSQNRYLCESTATENLTIPNPPLSGTRVHRVVARVRDKLHNVGESTYDWVLEVLPDIGTGTPNLPPSAISLATVSVSAGQPSVQDSHITDLRPIAQGLPGRPFFAGADAERPQTPLTAQKLYRTDQGYEELWNGSGWVPQDPTPPVAILRHTVAQTINREVDTALLFNTEEFDSHNGHSTSSNTSRYVAPRSGVYRVSGTVTWAAVASMRARLEAFFRINGSNAADLAGSTVFRAETHSSVSVNELSSLVELNAGDYIELFCWHNAGSVSGGVESALATLNTAPAYKGGCRMEAEWLRPL